MGGKAYDPLTASLMVPGLADCASWLAGRPVSVVRTASGQLAILAADVSSKALLSRMEQPAIARPCLQRQLETYRSLFASWRSERVRVGGGVQELHRAAELLRRFFAVLLPLHESYGAILARCVGEIRGCDYGDDLMIAATPSVLRWQMAQRLPLSSSKSIFEPGAEIPVPPSDIDSDLRDTQARVMRTTRGRTDDAVEWATHLAWVMVLKEWKFYLAKALHRHFSRVLWSTPGMTSARTMNSMSVDALLAALGGEG
jgi:hypothetical protein